MSDLRIKIKLGSLELEFEGSKDVYTADIKPIVARFAALGEQNISVTGAQSEASSKHKPLTMTAKAIAAKLSVDNGTGLLYAAAASLSVVKAREMFSRQELTDEMKSAVGYFKPTYQSNLSSYLETLSKQGVLIETSKDTFAVKDSERAVMEKKLAQ